GPVTMETDWFKLVDARLHLRPYSHPRMEMAVAASISPAGPKAAGKHGLGLLSIAAWAPAGFEVLGDHWEVMEEQAALNGTTVDRRQSGVPAKSKISWGGVADDGPDAPGAHRSRGTQENPARVLPHLRLPQPHHPAAFPGGDQPRRADRCVQPLRRRGRGHAGHGRRVHRPADRAVEGRLRRLPDDGRRDRESKRHPGVVPAV